MGDTTQRDMDDVDAVTALRDVRTDWRPVPLDVMFHLFDRESRHRHYTAALESYWDMHADGLVASCTVFSAIALLQRCFLAPHPHEAASDGEIVPACFWIAVKVTEGQDAGGMLFGSVVCHEWEKFSAAPVSLRGLLAAERHVLALLQGDVMQMTTFDTFVMCLRCSGLAQPTRQAAYRRGLELLILLEGRPETLSYKVREVTSALCTVLRIPAHASLGEHADLDPDRLVRAVQYVQSFTLDE